jgi:hypothetical protein
MRIEDIQLFDTGLRPMERSGMNGGPIWQTFRQALYKVTPDEAAGAEHENPKFYAHDVSLFR